MARVFAVGGTGFVGSHAVRACVRAGHEVWVASEGLRPGLLDDVADRVRFVPGNLLHWPELLEGLTASRPEVVVSCAAFGAGDAGLLASASRHPARAVEVNVGGFTNLLEAMRLFGVPRLVWTSSSVVFGPATAYPAAPLDEEAPSAPTTVYGGTKAMAECLARHYRREYRLESAALRLPLVYGPGRWYVGQASALHALFTAAARRQPAVVAAPPEPADLLYAPDAGRAVEACVSARTLPHDRYHVVGHRSSLADLARALKEADPDVDVRVEAAPRGAAEASGLRPERGGAARGAEPGFTPGGAEGGREPLMEPSPGGPGLPAMSTARIERDLGFRPEYDARRAAADFLRWLRAQG